MKILTWKQTDNITQFAVHRLAEYVKTSGVKCLVLGISGGIDSAVVGAIGLRTVNWLGEENYQIGIHYSFLDVQSHPDDLKRAREMAATFGFHLNEYDLTRWYESSPLLNLIPINHPRKKVAMGNIKCRLRMIALYNFAQLTRGIYLDTDDLSEEYMGFWTKHGDEGDVKIIQHLTKDEVYDLGEYLGVPKSILRAQPGDGLGVSENNLASDQLGLPYMMIDYIISRFIQNGFDTNGGFNQMEMTTFTKLVREVAEEINRTEISVLQVLHQALKTAFKRRYGDNVAHLLPNRTELGLPEIGTEAFNSRYLKAISSL